MDRVSRRRRRYRSRIQIVADILEVTKGGSRKTRIMYLGNLSFDLVKKYLDLLLNLGLLEAKNNDEKTYHATEKGRRFLEEFSDFQGHLEIVQAKKRILESSLSNTP